MKRVSTAKKNPELERAIRAIGGPEAVAHLMPITFRTLVYWRHRGRIVQSTHLVRFAVLAAEHGVADLDLTKLCGEVPSFRGPPQYVRGVRGVDEEAVPQETALAPTTG